LAALETGTSDKTSCNTHIKVKSIKRKLSNIKAWSLNLEFKNQKYIKINKKYTQKQNNSMDSKQ
jgi:hypothetical protein